MKEFIFQGQFSSFGNIKYSTFVFTLQHQISGRVNTWMGPTKVSNINKQGDII